MTKCKYCGEKAIEIGAGKLYLIHKDICEGARDYDWKTETYRVEREMPSVQHNRPMIQV